MLLLDLPAEILLLIFGHIGGAYFRRNLSSLTISKQWSIYAVEACLQKQHIDYRKMQRLLGWPDRHTIATQLQANMRVLSLFLQPQYTWHNLSVFFPPRKNSHAHWTPRNLMTRLNEDLNDIASIAAAAPGLRVLRMVASYGVNLDSKETEYWKYQSIGEHRRFLRMSTLNAFLSVPTLTTLDLDLHGSDVVNSRHRPFETKPIAHMCPVIAAMLPALHYLRLRLRCICTDILTPPPGCTALSLHTVILNLSLAGDDPDFISHSKSCRASYNPFLINRNKRVMLEQRNIKRIRAQAQALATHMQAAKMVRVLDYMISEPTDGIRAFDALSGKLFELPKNAGWDASGVEVAKAEFVKPNKVWSRCDGSDEDSEDEWYDRIVYT